MTAIYDEAVGRHGITIGQLSMLALTLVAEYSTAADLERLLLMERSTISRNLKRMRAQGWVANIPGERPRTLAIVATPKGRKLLERALPDWRAAQETARDLLGGAVVDEVRRVVDALPRAVEARRRLPAGRTSR